MMHASFGALALPDGTTRYRLWAPNADRIWLARAGQPDTPMQRAGDGFFEITTADPPGTRYRYRISPDLSVPDPASRLQDGDVSDDSIVTAPDAYPWRHSDWRGRPWAQTVLYELHPGLCGGYAGIQARLPALAKLGITAIELMPIADFPGERNWGYDGVLPYAPDNAYGTPDQLKELIDSAHGLGLMVFLDVVYNHFGPAGNYLSAYASDFFTSEVHTPWGDAIDFKKEPVRRFFFENALYWLNEFRFDGLRLDAVHAISEPACLPELAAFVRDRVAPDRQVHLVLENDDNIASHLRAGFDAQWNDDAHHVLHHLLTGESRAYYVDYADSPAEKLARALREGFIYQGDPSTFRKGAARGEPSADLAPSAFVFFLQNHDQIGNRALGERLIDLATGGEPALCAAVELQLLSPHIPLIFMGEEYGVRTPFLYFTSHADAELARAVRDGRRREFAGFNEFANEADRERIPDPNDERTYRESQWRFDGTGDVDGTENDTSGGGGGGNGDGDGGTQAAARAQAWEQRYRQLLELRHRAIIPGIADARALQADALGSHSVYVKWQLGNGHLLSIFCNLGPHDLRADRLSDLYDPLSQVLHESRPGVDAVLREDACLGAYCTIVLLRTEA